MKAHAHTSACSHPSVTGVTLVKAGAKDPDRLKPPAEMFHRDRVLRELMAAATLSYNRVIRDMLGAIREYLSADVIQGPIEKAGPKKPPGFATPAQLERIRGIIERYHDRAVLEIVGASALSPDALGALRAAGLIPGKPDTDYGLRIVEQAYQYGRGLGAQMPGTDRQRYQAASVSSWNRSDDHAALNATERASLSYAQSQAGQYITGLTDRVGADIVGLTVEEGNALRSAYREEVEIGIAQRDAWRAVASRMGDATADWSRDLQRVAATEMQQAHQAGVADTIRSSEGEDATVFKQPTPDACPECISLHLTGGPGSTPRLFKLSELEANGTNVGKKKKDWKAVVGTVHPWCACELHYMPDGWGFDEDGNMTPDLLRSLRGFPRDLMKSQLKMSANVPDFGMHIDVHDPRKRLAIEAVIATLPKQLQDKRVGVTYITLDYPRKSNHLECCDLAYWTGNEIRIAYSTPESAYPLVVRHELAHGLNVYLFNKLGSEAAVTEFHRQLNRAARGEGFVTPYAASAPIENHAEVTRLFLWEQTYLRRRFPVQWAMCHDAYRALFSGGVG
jgi:hypothetical protein